MDTATRWGDELLAELRDLYPALRRFAGVVGRFDVEPDDLVQEAYARFLSAPRTHVDDLGAYLRRTIVNVATNERRRRHRSAAAQLKLADDGVANDMYPSALADLLAVDPRDRALLYLVDIEGHTVNAAATIVGMNAPAARMAISRARKTLRAHLTTESDND